MAKTKEELNQLKTEYETLKNKLKELSEDELKQVTGGSIDWKTHNGVDIESSVSAKAQMEAWDIIFK